MKFVQATDGSLINVDRIDRISPPNPHSLSREIHLHDGRCLLISEFDLEEMLNEPTVSIIPNNNQDQVLLRIWCNDDVSIETEEVPIVGWVVYYDTNDIGDAYPPYPITVDGISPCTVTKQSASGVLDRRSNAVFTADVRYQSIESFTKEAAEQLRRRLLSSDSVQ